MRLIDLSQPVFADAPNCPVHPPVGITLYETHAGCGWQTERLDLVIHTGSHLDAPLHRIPGGKAIDAFPLETFVAPAVLVDLRDSVADQVIGAELLAERLAPALAHGPLAGCAILLATGWGDKRAKTEEWLRHQPHLDVAGARWLCDQGVRGIGIDHYTVGDGDAHTAILEREVWICEELRFSPESLAALAPPQRPTFMALPLNFRSFSGSFCRPVLML